MLQRNSILTEICEDMQVSNVTAYLTEVVIHNRALSGADPELPMGRG
jgi:hypothetical protein